MVKAETNNFFDLNLDFFLSGIIHFFLLVTRKEAVVDVIIIESHSYHLYQFSRNKTERTQLLESLTEIFEFFKKSLLCCYF